MKKYFLILISFILILSFGSADADVFVTFSPEHPRMGDIVDVTVSADENARSVIYSLSADDTRIFSGKEDPHFTVSFRPRTEAEYVLQATVIMNDGTKETAQVTVPVSGTAETQGGLDVIYSQKDGWWKKKTYGSSNLEKAGCALFTLSHAVQRMGYSGESVMPETFGKTYSGCLVEGGTANERLLTRAGEVFDFTTEDELYKSPDDIADSLQEGCFFSFSIVIGHIALATGLSEDGTKVRIIDSAPSATFERIKNGTIYYRTENGDFREAATAEDIPGFRWYFETKHAGGLEYWLELSYCARRGMRLIRPRWLHVTTENGRAAAELEEFGAARSTVTVNGEPWIVDTVDLEWTTDGTDQEKTAVVTRKKGVIFRNGNGDMIEGFKNIPMGTVLPVLAVEKDRIRVMYHDRTGYVTREYVNLGPVIPTGELKEGTLSLNGKTSGTAKVKIRMEGSPKAAVAAEWKIGTKVTVLGKTGVFYKIEAKGLQGWIHQDYLTMGE